MYQRRGGLRTYFSTYERKQSSRGQTTTSSKKEGAIVFPVAAENPRVLISSAGDQLLTLRRLYRMNCIRWRKQTD